MSLQVRRRLVTAALISFITGIGAGAGGFLIPAAPVNIGTGQLSFGQAGQLCSSTLGVLGQALVPGAADNCRSVAAVLDAAAALRAAGVAAVVFALALGALLRTTRPRVPIVLPMPPRPGPWQPGPSDRPPAA